MCTLRRLIGGRYFFIPENALDTLSYAQTGYDVTVNEMIDAKIFDKPNEKRVTLIFRVTIVDEILLKSEEHSEIGFYKTAPGKMIIDYFKYA